MSDSRGDGPDHVQRPAELPEAAVVVQLYAFYSAKRPSASKFVRVLFKQRVEHFEQSDTQRILGELPTLDPALRKTAGLAASVLRGKGAAQPACMEWLTTVLGLEFDGTWAEARSLRRAFQWYRQQLASGRSTAPARAFNALRIALLMLERERSIDPFELVSQISGVVESSRQRTKSDRDIEAAAARPFLKASSLTSLRELHGAVVLWLEQSIRARNEARQAEADRERALARLGDLQARASVAEESLVAARAAYDDQRAKAADLAERLQVAENARIHDLGAARARIRGFLQHTVQPRLVDARKAADWEPPRIDVLKERLETILDYIAQEDTWLTSD